MSSPPLCEIPLRAQAGQIVKHALPYSDGLTRGEVLGMIRAADALDDQYLDDGSVTDEAKEVVEDVLDRQEVKRV